MRQLYTILHYWAALLLVFACAPTTFAQKTKFTPRSPRRSVPQFQSDPVRLIKEFSLDDKKRSLSFNFKLAAQEALGGEVWTKLDEAQRASASEAFAQTLNDFWEDWDGEQSSPELVRVVKSKIKSDQGHGHAQVWALHGETLLRFRLAQSDGVWFIMDYEFTDEAIGELSDAVRGALTPEARRGNLLELEPQAARQQLDRLVAAEGEQPGLALLRVRLSALEQLQVTLQKDGQTTAPQSAPEPLARALVRLTERWPDFAPALLALGREILYSESGDDLLNPLSRDTASAIAALEHYAQLVPFDPRPYRDLAYAFDQVEKHREAEAAYVKAIELDPMYPEHYSALATFHLSHEENTQAQSTLARLLKIAPSIDAAFEQFAEERYDPDYAAALEKLLLAFPKELAASASGQTLLARVEEAQNKTTAAIKSVQRAIAIEADADLYEYLSELYRAERRFPEALGAAGQAIKLDPAAADAYFERACALAQLGRKREALVALKKIIELDPQMLFNPEEPDLQPLAALPEFKALKEKIVQSGLTAPTAGKSADQNKGGKPKPH